MALPISTQGPTELCLPNPGPSHPILLSLRGRTLTLPLSLRDGQGTTLYKHIIPQNILIFIVQYYSHFLYNQMLPQARRPQRENK